MCASCEKILSRNFVHQVVFEKCIAKAKLTETVRNG